MKLINDITNENVGNVCTYIQIDIQQNIYFVSKWIDNDYK